MTVAFLAVAAWSSLEQRPRPLTERDVRLSVDQALASQVPGPPFSVLAYEVIRPSLVLIQTTSDVGAGDGRGRVGVVIDAAGTSSPRSTWSTTATTITVTFADGTKAAAVTGAATRRTTSRCSSPTGPAVIVPAVLGNPAALQHRQRGVHRRQPVRALRLA